MSAARQNQDYGIEHAPECASGERAEVRGACDCGADDRRPWKIRSLPNNHGKPMVQVVVSRLLSGREAVELALSLQEMTRIGAEAWSKQECKRLEKEAIALRAKKDAECFCGELASVDRPCKVCKKGEAKPVEKMPAVRAAICQQCGSGLLDGSHLRDDLAPCFGDEERPPWEKR